VDEAQVTSLSQNVLATLHSCGHYYQTDVQGCILYFDASQDSFVLHDNSCTTPLPPANVLKYITDLMRKDLCAGQEQSFGWRLKPWPDTGNQ